MKLAIGIQGLGCISPWGNDLNSFVNGYLEGRSAIVPIDRFATKDITCPRAGIVGEFEPKKYIEPKNVRKFDFFSRLGIASAKLALESMPAPILAARLEDMGIVYSCETQGMITASYLEDLVRHGPDLVSPKLFSVAAANSAACNISSETGIQGPSVNVSAKFASGFLSVFTGLQMIESGQLNDCLVGSIDYLSQVVMEAHSRMGCYEKDGVAGSGIVPGEGTASVVLSKGEAGNFGVILGAGYECSKTENYRWPRDHAVHARVLRAALGEYTVDRYQAAYNGDPRVEKLENTVLAEVFAGANKPEVVRLKGLLGEFSAMPIFQLMAACAEPAGTRTLISVLSPGGTHGALLVESSGLLGSVSRMEGRAS